MIVRYNMYPSAPINGNPAPGTSSGQAIVSSWDVQSGFHPNPDVIYSGTNSAPQNEVLKLVE